MTIAINGKNCRVYKSLQPSVKVTYSSKTANITGRTSPRILSTPLPATSCGNWWIWALLALLKH